MSGSSPGGSVVLSRSNASELLHSALAEAVRAFPAVFEAVGFPEDAGAFRARYPALMPRFEAARLASAERRDIASHIVSWFEDQVLWQDDSGQKPLAAALAEPAAPLPLRSHTFGAAPGWQPSLVYNGRRFEADALNELGAALVERRVVTAAAGRALSSIQADLLQDGRLNLSGRRIAVLGGGAEMAPTRFWLEAGAEVLWVDIAPPPENWFESDTLAGRLHWAEAGADLLSQPREILATLLAFSDGTPMDLGLYAYAPGQAREVRLTSVMNALVGAMPAGLVASATILVSPTTPTGLSAEDRDAMAARLAARPGWESVLGRIGALGRGDGAEVMGGAAATRTVVAIQGTSYQAAQYVGKVLTAERWNQPDATMRVSANTAAITRTRSLAHPVFTAAFGGASAFGVETLTPRQSRCLNGLLAVHDWLAEQPPVPGAVRVHGGIHTLPYPLESALKIAAGIGFARSPRLLKGLLGGR